MPIQAVQDLKRLREISVVVVRHGFGELWDRAKIWDVLGRREEAQKPSPGSTARRFRETLAELGPTFIKLGQILSSRPDILPKDFIDELSHLQDRASPMAVELVFELISRLHREHGLTSLIVTHNMDFARRCDRVLRMAGGRVEELRPESLPA